MTTNMVRLCARCQNHGLQVELKGHKRLCPFRTCQCSDGCSLTELRQVLNRKRFGEPLDKHRRLSAPDTLINNMTLTSPQRTLSSHNVPLTSHNGSLTSFVFNNTSSMLSDVASSLSGESNSENSGLNRYIIEDRHMSEEEHLLSSNKQQISHIDKHKFSHPISEEYRHVPQRDKDDVIIEVQDDKCSDSPNNECSLLSNTECRRSPCEEHIMSSNGMSGVSPSDERRASFGIKHRILSTVYPVNASSILEHTLPNMEYTAPTPDYTVVITEYNTKMPEYAGHIPTAQTTPVLVNKAPIEVQTTPILIHPSQSPVHRAPSPVHGAPSPVQRPRSPVHTVPSPVHRVKSPVYKSRSPAYTTCSPSVIALPPLHRPVPIHTSSLLQMPTETSELSLISDVILKVCNNNGREALKKVEQAYQELLRYTYPPSTLTPVYHG